MADSAEIFRTNLKRIIENLGISEAEAARRANMKPALLSRYSTGRSIPGLEVLDRLAKALNVPISELVSESARIALQIDALTERIEWALHEVALSDSGMAKWDEELLKFNPDEIVRRLLHGWAALDRMEQQRFAQGIALIIERLQRMAISARNRAAAAEEDLKVFQHLRQPGYTLETQLKFYQSLFGIVPDDVMQAFAAEPFERREFGWRQLKKALKYDPSSSSEKVRQKLQSRPSQPAPKVPKRAKDEK